MIADTIRRILFVLFLVVVPPLSLWLFYKLGNGTSIRIRLLVLGLNCSFIIFSVWLIGRNRIWTTTSGWIRILVYSIAFLLGNLLIDVFSDGLIRNKDFVSFDELPSDWEWWIQKLRKSSRRLMGVASSLFWLLPFFVLTDTAIAKHSEPNVRSWKVSVFVLMLWTALMAISIHYISDGRWDSEIFGLIRLHSGWLIDSLVVGLILLSVSLRFRYWPLMFLLCVVLKMTLYYSAYETIDFFKIRSGQKIPRNITYPQYDWLWNAASVLTACFIFGGARFLGVGLRKSTESLYDTVKDVADRLDQPVKPVSKSDLIQ